MYDKNYSLSYRLGTGVVDKEQKDACQNPSTEKPQLHAIAERYLKRLEAARTFYKRFDKRASIGQDEHLQG